MLTIPMGSTENNSSISILDLLLEKGVLQRDNQISEEEYTSWILKHKKHLKKPDIQAKNNMMLMLSFYTT